jgi:exopolysaccharide production protein ExoQ
MQNSTISSNWHVPHLVVTWVLMIPLVFFAIDGALRFDTYSGNNDLRASYSQLIQSPSQDLTQTMQKMVFVICALLLCTRPHQVVDIAKNNKVFVLLFTFAVASAIWSQFPRESLMRGTYVTMDVLFAFYLAARFNPDRQMQLFLTLGWIVTLASIAAALFFPQYGMDHEHANALGAWIGIFNHKNWCSIMVTFLLCGAFYIRPSSSFLRSARIAYIILSLLLIVMSQSRTGWVVAACLLLYVAVTKYLKRYKARDRLFISILFGGMAVIVTALFVEYYTAITLLIGKDPTLTGRTTIWTLVLNSIMKHPLLGYGFQAYWHGLQGESGNISLADHWIVPAAHNGFLDLWLGLGAIGVGIVVYSMLQAGRNAFTCFRGGISSSAQWYLCIVVLTVVSNVAELTLMVPDYLAWIMYVLACVGLSQEAKRIRLRAQPVWAGS